MSNNLTFGMRVTYEGKAATAGLEETRAGVEKVSAAAGKAGGAAKQFGTASEDASKRAAAGFGKARDGADALAVQLNRLQALALSYVGFSQFVNFGKALIDTSVAMDGFNAKMAIASGSAKNVAAEYEYLRQLSNRLGTEVRSTADAYASFAAAARGTALEGAKAREVFTGVATASARMSLTADAQQGVFLALSQMMSKGVVSAEEFRQQLGERLPVATTAGAAALGVTTAEFVKLLNSGKLLSEEFLPKFAAQLEKMAGGGGPVDNLQASINRLSNNWTEFQQAVSKSAALKDGTDWFAGLAAGATDVANAVNRTQQEYGTLIALLAGVGFSMAKMTGVELDPQKRAQADLNGMLKEQLALRRDIALLSERGGRLEAEKAAEARARLSELNAQIKAQIDLVNAPVNAAGAAAAKRRADEEAQAATRAASAKKTVSDEQIKTIEAEKKAYDKLNESVTARIAVLTAEVSGETKLTESQKKLVELGANYKEGLTAQNEASQQAGIALLAQAAGLELAAAAKAEATKADEAATKARQASMSALSGEYDALVKKLEADKYELSIIGKTKEQIALLSAARGDDALQIKIREAAQLAATSSDEARLHVLREEIKLMLEIRAIGTDTAAAIAADEISKEHLKAQQDTWKSINDVAHDTLVSIADDGKDTAQRLKGSFKNGFFDWLHSMTLKKWIFNISAAATGTSVSGMAAASSMGGGSGGAGAGSWLSGASSIYSAVNAGITTSISQGVAQVGATFWNAGAEQIGNAIMANIAPMTAAISYLGAGMAGITIGTMIAGDKEVMGMSGQTTSTAGAIIGAIVGGPIGAGIGAAIGGIIGGLINAAFGMGPVQSGTTTLAGQFGSEGFAGQYQTPWHQEGGWFRSDRSGVNSTALGQEQVDAFAAVTEGTASVFNNLIAASGDATRSLDGWNFAINRQVATQEQQNQLVIDMAESMGNYLIPSLEAFKAEGENLADTAVRMRDEFVLTSSVAALLGQDINAAFGEIGLASMAARDNLVQLMGGIQGMNATVQSYYQNFFSDTERHALELTALSGKFTQLGQAIPETRDSYRDLIEAQDMSTESGRQMFAALMALNGEFAALVPVIEEVARASFNAAEIAKANLGWQQQIDVLTGTQTQRQVELANAIEGADASTARLINQLFGLQDAANDAAAAAELAQAARQQTLQTAQTTYETAKSALLESYNRESQAAQQLADKMRGFASGFAAMRDSLALGNFSPLSPLEKYLEATRQFDDVSARAALGDTEAMGQFGGVRDAFLRASQDYNASSEAFAADYNRAQNATQRGFEVASRHADIATSQVTLLQGQLSALGLINTSVLSVVDAMAAFTSASAALAAVVQYSAPQAMDRISGMPGAPSLAQEVSQLYQNMLGREADPGGLVYWAARAAGEGGVSALADEFRGAAIANGETPRFAAGGDHEGGLRIVGESGPELEATGPSRIFNHDQARQILSGGGNNNELIAELKALRAEVAKLREENAKQADKVAGAVGDAADANTLDLRGLKQSLAHSITRMAA